MRRVAGKKRLFIDRNQVVILVYNVDRNIHRLDFTVGTRNLDLQFIARVQNIYRSDMLAVERYSIFCSFQTS